MANSKTKKIRVSSKDKEYFTQNLAIMLKASVPVGEALNSFSETAKSKSVKKAVSAIQKNIDEGYSFYDALKASGIVSDQTLALVSLGEKSGNLSENLQVASEQEEKQRTFRAKILSALIYPTFVLSLTGIVGLVVAWFLLPKLSNTFSQLNTDLPFISQVFIGFGDFLEKNGIWAVPLGILIVLAIIYIIFFFKKTNHIGQAILFKIPGISKLLNEVEIARFGYLLGTLLKSGLTIVQALDLLEKATGARPYKKAYRSLKEGFENGNSFKSSIGQYKHVSAILPSTVQQIVVAGEKSGSLPETLMHIGDTYEGKADITSQNLQSYLEPILLVIVWFGVLGVAIAVILPIYQLVGGLNG